MTREHKAAAKQLAQAVGYWLDRLEVYGFAQRLRDPRAYAQQVIADLTSEDAHVAAEAAVTIGEWEPWTDHTVSAVPADWWQTPLGRLVLLAQTSGEMSVPEAQSALRVSRGRVYQLLDSGGLERGPAGGVSRRSVARRLEPQA